MENPYQVVGTRFTKDEHELLEMGLTGVATAADQHGDTAVKQRCMDLMERLRQYVVAGEGMSQEMAESFGKKINRAMLEQNEKALIVTLRKWIASLIRLDPDPAKTVANHVTRFMLMIAGQSHVQSGGFILRLVEKKLLALKKRYPDGLPPELLDYLLTWVEHGKENLENGQDAWAGDEDLREPSPDELN